MKVIFMGTPDFAVPSLEALIRSEHQVAAVVTQPDRPKGRSKKLVCSPVKELALKYEIPVLQPHKASEEAFLEQLEEIKPDVAVVAAYGQIIGKRLLQLPRYGCINVHGSLLPKLRGAAPIQWAVLQGDKEAGVTIMQMAEGVDTGDILKQGSILLDERETGGSLFHKLSILGAELLTEVLQELEEGGIQPVPQTGESTYVGMLTKEMGQIDWNRDAEELDRLIRGLNPWPSAYTKLRGKTLKIWDARVDHSCSGEPGTIVSVDKKQFTVAAGKGGLSILELQWEGKKRMTTDAFLRGVAVEPGESLA